MCVTRRYVLLDTTHERKQWCSIRSNGVVLDAMFFWGYQTQLSFSCTKVESARLLRLLCFYNLVFRLIVDLLVIKEHKTCLPEHLLDCNYQLDIKTVKRKLRTM